MSNNCQDMDAWRPAGGCAAVASRKQSGWGVRTRGVGGQAWRRRVVRCGGLSGIRVMTRFLIQTAASMLRGAGKNG
jgi:hypothetical protein